MEAFIVDKLLHAVARREDALRDIVKMDTGQAECDMEIRRSLVNLVVIDNAAISEYCQQLRAMESAK